MPSMAMTRGSPVTAGDGPPWLGPMKRRRSASLKRRARRPRTDGLTAREVEILQLVANGLTNRQLADQLGVSIRTVDAHLRSVYAKLNVKSRSAATRYAVEHHLV